MEVENRNNGQKNPEKFSAVTVSEVAVPSPLLVVGHGTLAFARNVRLLPSLKGAFPK